jgi:RsiW-degrading membrane proteinase PrsW (M82 family)
VKIKLAKLLKDPDFIGWMIWLVLTAALAPVFIHLMFTYTYDTASAVVRYIVGLFAAAMLSGLLSVGINELLFRFRRKRGTSKRKDVKKTAKGRAR